MTAIRLNTFKGEIPSYSPNLLPNEASVIALDCHFDDGTLNPIRDNLDTGGRVRPSTESLYRYEDAHWFQWDTDVDVMKSPIARDQYRRVYWTDGSYPKVTYNTIFNGSGSLPVNHFQLGVMAPANPPVIASFTPPLDQESAVTVFYTITYVTGAGEEGAPSTASKPVNCNPIGVEVPTADYEIVATVSYVDGTVKIVDKYGKNLDDFSYAGGVVSWNADVPKDGMEIAITATQQNVVGLDSAEGSYSATVTGPASAGANNPAGAPVVTIVNDANGDGILSPDEVASKSINMTVGANDADLLLGGYVLIKMVVAPNNPDTKDTGQVVLTLQPPGTNRSNIERIKIYRTVTGAGLSEFLAVGEVPISQSTFTDKTPDSGLGETLATETFSMPPDGMLGICSMANGISAGFIDNELLFSEVYLPYAWPEAYRHSIDYDVVAIEPIGTSLVVGTKGDPYLYTGISPGNIAGQKLEIAQACVSKRSMINIGPAVVYACPDGLIAIAPDGVSMATENIIKPMQWREMLDPSTIKAYRHESKYVAIHSKGAFIFDLVAGDFRRLNDAWTAGYTDPKDDTLYVVKNGEVIKFRGGAANKTLKWKSKEFESISNGFSCCRITADNINEVSFKLFADDVEVFSKPLGTVIQTFTLPPVRADKWQFELESTSRIESVKIATSKQELKS